MAYRPEWFPKCETNDAGILGIALNVVGYIRGSYDCMTDSHALDIRALEWVIENWDHKYSCGKEGDDCFDLQILELIKTALSMEKIDKEIRGY